MRTIYFAGGCFWGAQGFFSQLNGVLNTVVGYANGATQNPTYEEVCTGSTGFAEAVMVNYDENIISTGELLEKYFSIIDPTLLNRQAGDIGPQYRTGIYYIEGADIKKILLCRDKQSKLYSKPIYTEILPLDSFYEAEEYHQDYLKKNPNGYCHIKF
ncbi:MAG: peptide-methionine (S)-S-oxide reductase MsrA [Clostridiales bacterium]|nr:peptide-methionine (S)-S-oxide reductase MsrA [Clostridiales bacterium]